MNAFEEKRAARVERLRDAADRARVVSADRSAAASAIADRIPFGQPILVGHHSERRARRDAERIHTNMGKAIEASARADELERKADRLEASTAISSDDPEAVKKLIEKREKLVSMRDKMKAANKTIKAAKGNVARAIAGLVALGFTEAQAVKLLSPDFCGRIGFPSFELTNSGAEIRRIDARIAELRARASSPMRSESFGEVRVEESETRVQVFFPGKPSEAVRSELKSRGFRWAPSEGAWQAYRSEGAWQVACRLAASLIEG